MHPRGLGRPIHKAVLHDTEGVDPDLADSEPLGNRNRILKSLWKTRNGDALVQMIRGIFCESIGGRAAPAMGDSGVTSGVVLVRGED